MKKLIIYPWLLVFIITAFIGCSDSPSSSNNNNGTTTEASEQRQFVWNAMNYWYYWQKEVPQLADNHSYFDSDQDFQNYLMSFTNTDSLFEDLQYKDDRFSFFIDDYEAYHDRNQGIYAAYGFEYGYLLLHDNYTIIGYVQYILPDGPAANTDLKRGQIFTKIDGQSINIDNYRSLLQDQATHTLTLAKLVNNGNDTKSIQETDKTVTLASQKVTEDPVFASKDTVANGIKVGYLVYNAFHSNTHQELNDVFAEFKNKGIDELILDLRYNGGGALITSQTLSSMISGQGSSDEFAEITFNDKRAAQNDEILNFYDKVLIPDENGDFYDDQNNLINSPVPMNKLSLNHVYILMGYGTASASEALINALKAYMNDVTLIGEQTVGKDEGSITLYDAPEPYTDETEANPDHKIALQPIVLKITNKNHNPYSDGFTPDYKVSETDYLNDLPPLGSFDDPLVSKALSLITGQPQKAKIKEEKLENLPFKHGIFRDSRDLRPHSKIMYVDPSQVK